MPIIVNLDVMMEKRKMSLNELSEKVGLTLSNLSILKTGKAKAIRFSTLEAICKTLDCQPADILELKKKKKKALFSSVFYVRLFYLHQNIYAVQPVILFHLQFDCFRAKRP